MLEELDTVKDEWNFEGKYYGETTDGMPHGHGVWIRNDHDIYIGTWKNGKRHGKGRSLLIYLLRCFRHLCEPRE